MLELFQAQCKEFYFLKVLPASFVTTETTNKTFQNSYGTDRYTLIEQLDDFTNHMLSSDSGNSTLIWNIMKHNRAQWSIKIIGA